MQERLRILLIEDNPGDVVLLREALYDAAAGAYEVTTAVRLAEGLEKAAATTFDVALLDLSLPDSQGIVTLQSFRNGAPDLPVIVLSGTEDEALGDDLIREGAQDYLVKGRVSAGAIGRSMRYAIERHRLAHGGKSGGRSPSE
jgi:DNA-binding NarL/FixJ family response regulator